MRLTSAHRNKIKADNSEPPDDLPQVTIDGQEAKPDLAVSVEVGPDVEPHEGARQAINEAIEADEAAAALKRQIAELHHAEQLQRDAAQAANIHAMPLEDKIALWRRNGLTDREADFLRQNPEVANYPEVSGWAANTALNAGHERDSQEYFQAVKQNFEEAMRHLQAQAASPQVPEFFRAPPARQAMPRSPAHYVSAPVVRDAVPTATPRPVSPAKITLSAEQREHARVAGVSETEYARQLLRLETEKRAGMRQT